jgi:hypothetical protein
MFPRTYHLRFSTKILLGGSLLFAQASFAQCSRGPSPTENTVPTAMPPTASSQNSNRDEVPTTFVTSIHAVQLEIKLKKSGAVREATFLLGPEELRKAAIKAAKARKYKSLVREGSPNDNVINLQVSFPHGRKGPPEIARVPIAGVPGCIYVTRVRVSPAIMQLHLLQRVDPIYPPEMPNASDQLVLQLIIDKDGNVSSVVKLSGPDQFALAAIETVKKWKYEPYSLNGEPVDVDTTVTLPDESLTNPACIPHLPCPID